MKYIYKMSYSDVNKIEDNNDWVFLQLESDYEIGPSRFYRFMRRILLGERWTLTVIK